MPDTHRDLRVLEDAGLVRLARLEPEVECLFRHDLLRDATYNTMLSCVGGQVILPLLPSLWLPYSRDFMNSRARTTYAGSTHRVGLR
jgi:hypothetical protein